MFAFAAAAFPAVTDPALALGAWADGARLVGAAVAERDGPSALLYGPVVVSTRVDSPAVGRGDAPTANASDAMAALEIAEQLVAAAVDHATALGVQTLFARPQGLDRVWVRFGFIPVPEVALPAGLRGRPGAGLFAYRGGSALWSLRPASSDRGGDDDQLGPRPAAGSPDAGRRRSARTALGPRPETGSP
jgi:hypothetical protein